MTTMKVVVGGKGGAGKTTVAAVLARILAQRGTTVIALDGDPNPNLGIALGLGCNQTAGLDSVVNAVFKERAGGGHSDRAGRPVPDRHADELLEELGVTAPDGVRLVQCGRIERPADGCLCCGSHITTRRMFAELSGQGRVVIADLEPGVNDLIWINPGSQDAVVIVTQPSRKSLEVTRRALQIADDFSVGRTVVVANRAKATPPGGHVGQCQTACPPARRSISTPGTELVRQTLATATLEMPSSRARSRLDHCVTP